MRKDKILLLEDDQSFGYILTEYLGMHNFDVLWVKSAESALEKFACHYFDLAILDVMLPNMDGFELAQIMKKRYRETPFIFLSAKSLKIDKLKGFKLGAYDYITKPVDEELLVAKIGALLQLKSREKNVKESISIGDYLFLPNIFQLQYKNSSIKLTAREAELLRMLCEHKDELLCRKKALQEIWGTTDEFNRKSMDVFISRLRKYFQHDSGIKIVNIHAKGFVFTY